MTEHDPQDPSASSSDAGDAGAPDRGAAVGTTARDDAWDEADGDDALDEDDVDEDDDDLDLAEFDGEGGLEGALSRMREADAANEAFMRELEEIGTRSGPWTSGRHPYLAVAVTLVSLVLCGWLWSDLRFYLESDPRDLGDLKTLMADGGDGLAEAHDRYVTVRGTPDITYAAKMTLGDTTYRFVRLIEGGARAFALVPSDASTRFDVFSGSFTGRAKRLGDLRFYDEVVRYFDNEGVSRTYETQPEALAAALATGERGLFEAEAALGGARTLTVRDVEQVQVVVDQGDLKLVLGRATWPDDAAAEAAVKSLGLPYTRLETVVAGRDDPNANVKRSYGRSFVVRVPRARHAEVVAQLHAAVGMETESADPKVGAVGVPYRATYVVRPSALAMSDDEVVIDMRGVTTRPRLELREGALVSADLDAQGRLHVPADEVTRVEVTSSLRIDPDGTIILADQRPEGQARGAIMFAMAALVGLLNLIAVVMFVRRRRET